MLGFKNFLMEEDGVGVVEMVLIVVVLIGIVEYYCVCSPFTDAGGAASFHTFRSSETL